MIHAAVFDINLVASSIAPYGRNAPVRTASGRARSRFMRHTVTNCYKARLVTTTPDGRRQDAQPNGRAATENATWRPLVASSSASYQNGGAR